jgi:hypothetical protein
MAEPNKAIGLRLNPNLWKEIKKYGLLKHPGDKSKEGFDVTQTITELLAKALEIPLDELVKHSFSTSDQRIAEIVKGEVEVAIQPINTNLLELMAEIQCLSDRLDKLETTKTASKTKAR